MTANLPQWLLDALGGVFTVAAMVIALKIGLVLPIGVVLAIAWTAALIGRCITPPPSKP